jgi:uncharacterized protein
MLRQRVATDIGWQQLLSILGIVAVLILQTGCASSSVLRSYPDRINKAISFAREGQVELAEDVVHGGESDANFSHQDSELYRLEAGRFATVFKDPINSITHFEEALSHKKQEEEGAVVDTKDAVGTLGAVLLNDNAIAYEMAPYEEAFALVYAAMNYLMVEDFEKAGVTARRLARAQIYAKKEYERKIEKAQEKLDAKMEEQSACTDSDTSTTNAVVSASAPTSMLAEQYAEFEPIAQKVKHAFGNAYAWYLNGLIFEAGDNDGLAYKCYTQAWKLQRANSVLKHALLRLSKSQNQEHHKAMLSAFKNVEVGERKPNEGEVIIFLETGLVPQMVQLKVLLPIGKQILSMAVPTYPAEPYSNHVYSVSVNGREVGTTEELCDLQALACRNLQDRLPIIVSRMVIRAIGKYAINKAARDRGGRLAFLVAQAANVATERADLRAWYTLPAYVQTARMTLPEGYHELTLKNQATNHKISHLVNVNPGKISLALFVSSQGMTFAGDMVLGPSRLPISREHYPEGQTTGMRSKDADQRTLANSSVAQ